LDKLRQLAIKFLELEELANFKFQSHFLKPFKFIFENNPDIKIKDMVLTCVNHIVQFKAVKLRSGWKTLLVILGAAASGKTETIVNLGFNITKTIHSQYLDFVLTRNGYSFLVDALSKYCQAIRYPKIRYFPINPCSQAVAILKDGAERVSLMPENEDKPTLATGQDDQFESNDQLWIITLRNLNVVIITCELDIRNKYVNTDTEHCMISLI
jgi:brefeldin A-inhibited guanine nucleotide-exchange protein